MTKKSLYSFCVQIYGCQMNYADAERIVFLLEKKGGILIKDPEKADFIVIVSCGVRRGAEQRAISWMKKLRIKNQNAFIVLTGCLSLRKDIQRVLADVADLSLPVFNFKEALEKFLIFKKKEKNEDKKELQMELINSPFDATCFYATKTKRFSRYRAHIPIMSGCNNFCSYCVVPYARGKEVSRSPEEIIREVKQLINQGYKEIYLLGQNVNSYKGRDKQGAIWNFACLLEKIDAIKGNFWVKYLSSHPKDVDVLFLKTLALRKKISYNLHLPIQSGSTRILGLMNRKYSKEHYLNLVQKIRKYAPKTVLSSDIIVGFPSETKEDFKDSLEVLKKCQFEMLYSLKYSPRPGTEAFKMKDDVSIETKKIRQKKLDGEWKKIADKLNQRFVGKELVMLVDKIKEKGKKEEKELYYYWGRSFEDKNVYFILKERIDLVGKWAKVVILKASPLCLEGKFLMVEKEG